MVLSLLAGSAAGSNPFTSTVVPLSASNWTVLERSPHLWMVNVCRQS
jgi:hypothetical protein